MIDEEVLDIELRSPGNILVSSRAQLRRRSPSAMVLRDGSVPVVVFLDGEIVLLAGFLGLLRVLGPVDGLRHKIPKALSKWLGRLESLNSLCPFLAPEAVLSR